MIYKIISVAFTDMTDSIDEVASLFEPTILPMKRLGVVKANERFVGVLETPLGTGTCVYLADNTVLMNLHLIFDIDRFKTDINKVNDEGEGPSLNLKDYFCDLSDVDAYFVNEASLFIYSFENALISTGLALLQESSCDNWDFAVLKPIGDIASHLGGQGMYFSRWDHHGISIGLINSLYIHPPTLNFETMEYSYNVDEDGPNAIDNSLDGYAAILPDHTASRPKGNSGSIATKCDEMFLFNFQQGRLLPAAHLKNAIEGYKDSNLGPTTVDLFLGIDTRSLTKKKSRPKGWGEFLPWAKQVLKKENPNLRILAIYDLFIRNAAVSKQAKETGFIPEIYRDNGVNVCKSFKEEVLDKLGIQKCEKIQQVNDLITLAGDGTLPEAGLKELKFYVDKMGRELDTYRVVTGTKEDIAVGTEFTFSSDITRGNRFVEGSLGWAKTAICKWRKDLEGHSVTGRTITKQGEGESGLGFKVAYDNGWWWVLGADDCCLETQTKPTTLDEFNDTGKNIKSIIRRDIFECAARVGLFPDPSELGGGGHISLDAKNLVGTNLEIVLSLLEDINSKSKDWDAYYQYNQEDAERNCAWMSELESGGKQANIEFSEQKNKAMADLLANEGAFRSIFDKFNQSFFKTIRNTKAEALIELNSNIGRNEMLINIGKTITQCPEHYQGINVEHLIESDALKRRIEFRRIPAQRSVDELERHIVYLLEIVQGVWNSVLDAQKNRLESF
ncbi:hypothetical protein HOH45_01435 [bacterium]|jgi:hypothetical protein|nr:hypothetical protein [bacterium]